MAQLQVFTIGHSNHALDLFIDLLQQHQVETLIDVRRYPSSRRLPHFNRDNLATAPEENGIGYHWLESLGGRRQKRTDFDSPNYGIADESFRNYADYMLSEEFRRGVSGLLEIAAEQRTAIMCAEADYQQCHRRLVSDCLVANGVDVRHILGDGELKVHTLTQDALVVDGTVAAQWQ